MSTTNVVFKETEGLEAIKQMCGCWAIALAWIDVAQHFPVIVTFIIGMGKRRDWMFGRAWKKISGIAPMLVAFHSVQ